MHYNSCSMGHSLIACLLETAPVTTAQMAWNPPTCVGRLPEKQNKTNFLTSVVSLALLPCKTPSAIQVVSLNLKSRAISRPAPAIHGSTGMCSVACPVVILLPELAVCFLHLVNSIFNCSSSLYIQHIIKLSD